MILHSFLRKAQLSFSIGLLFCLLGGTFLVHSSLADTTADHVVISEIRLSGGTGKSTDEFVELYNPTGQPVDISGWRLVKYTKAGLSASSTLVLFSPSSIIPAHGFWLVAHTDYVVIQNIAADSNYLTSSLSDDSSIALVSSGGNTVDLVGWGKATLFEGSAALVPTTALLSLKRLPGGDLGFGQDTNNNGVDFVRTVSDPHNHLSSSIPSLSTSPTIGATTTTVPGITSSTGQGVEVIEQPSSTSSGLDEVTSESGVGGTADTSTVSENTTNTSSSTTASSSDQVFSGTTSTVQTSTTTNAGSTATTSSNPLSLPEPTTTLNFATVEVGDVVINEFVSDPTTGNDEFVELYNTTSSTIDLTGWRTEEGSGSKTELSGLILPHDFYVVEKPHGSLNNGGDRISVFASSTVINAVAYGDWDDGNVGDNAPVAGDPWSVARRVDGVDTGNNSADFVITTVITKGATNSIQELPVVVPTTSAAATTVNSLSVGSVGKSLTTSTPSIASTTVKIKEKKPVVPVVAKENLAKPVVKVAAEKLSASSESEKKASPKTKAATTAKPKKVTASKKATVKAASLQTIYSLDSNTKVVVRGVVVTKITGGFLLAQTAATGTIFAVAVKAPANRTASLQPGDEILFQATVHVLKTQTNLQVKAAGSWQVVGTQAIPEPQQISLGELDDDSIGSFVQVQGEITDSASGQLFVDDDTGEAVVITNKTASKSKKPNYFKGDTVQVTGIINQLVDGVPQIVPLDGGVEKVKSASTTTEVAAATTHGYQWPIVGLGVTSAGASWWYKKRQKKMLLAAT